MKRNVIAFFLIGIMFFFLIPTSTGYQAESVVAEEPVAVTTTASSVSDVEVKWSRTWGGTSYDYGYSVWGDGTYLYTLGGTGSFGAGSYDFALVKWDTDGNIIWSRTWGGIDYDYGYSVWGDGTYLYALGGTRSFGAGNSDFALVKWDTDGNIIWNRTWGGVDDDSGYSIWGDGTYLYALGDTWSFGAGSSDLALVKWDADGNIIWNRTWGGIDDDDGHSIWGDGTYLYSLGDTYSFGAGYVDFALVKWDADGNIIWSRTWGGGTNNDWGRSIWGDGTYLYALGGTWSFGAGSSDLALVKWDADGNIIWSRTWGGTDSDYARSVWGDGTYLYAFGTTHSFGVINGDLALVAWGPDTTMPVLDSPDDIAYEQGVSGNNISWRFDDYNPASYIIYKDNVEIDSDTWSSEATTTINVDGLSLGDYNYTIVVYDTSGNSATDTVTVTVEDTTCPILSNPTNISYEQGETGNSITWTVTDYNPANYIIYRDNIEVDSDTWTSEGTTTINVDGLLVGEHNYTIVVTDTSGNFDRDTVIVTVEDTTAPVLNNPSAISYKWDTTGHNIVWIATDYNPDTYVVYKDSIEIASGNWISGESITINVDGLTPGTYDYTIVITDMYGYSVSDTVIVTVTGAIMPTIENPAVNAILIASVIAIILVAVIVFLRWKRKSD